MLPVPCYPSPASCGVGSANSWLPVIVRRSWPHPAARSSRSPLLFAMAPIGLTEMARRRWRAPSASSSSRRDGIGSCAASVTPILGIRPSRPASAHIVSSSPRPSSIITNQLPSYLGFSQKTLRRSSLLRHRRRSPPASPAADRQAIKGFSTGPRTAARARLHDLRHRRALVIPGLQFWNVPFSYGGRLHRSRDGNAVHGESRLIAAPTAQHAGVTFSNWGCPAALWRVRIPSTARRSAPCLRSAHRVSHRHHWRSNSRFSSSRRCSTAPRAARRARVFHLHTPASNTASPSRTG